MALAMRSPWSRMRAWGARLRRAGTLLACALLVSVSVVGVPAGGGLARAGAAELSAHDVRIGIHPDSTRFALTLVSAPMPEPIGFSACISRTTRRPTPESAPTDAKATCLYPNGARAIAEAVNRGYQNAVVLDALGNVAEFATSNLFCVKDGVCFTPAPNGTFLNGITRQRVIDLLRRDGVEVIAATIRPERLYEADEIFSTGNYAKVMPLVRFEDRDLQPGPVYRRARALYWAFAHDGGVPA